MEGGVTAARIAFAGTPAFAVPALEAIVAAGAHVPLVLTQPDRPAGRGRKLTPPPVKEAALAHGLPVAQPSSLADAAVAREWGLDRPPDLLVVVAYGLLLPRWVLDWPARGCVNIHASLLPRWRGAAPIQHAILAGDAETGISLMRMDEGLDTGPVYCSRSIPIEPTQTAGELHDRLARLGAELLAESLPALLSSELTPVPQDEALATYAPKIAKADARLDFHKPAERLAREVRAYHPWPVAFAEDRDGRVLRVHAAEALAATEDAARFRPGQVVAASRDGIDVKAGDGVLRLLRVQPPSSRVMDAAAYLAAHSVEGVEFV
ncbi:MAG: methionyl-tRNA formyltransferase [Gammaproteobacteria bacterium]